MRITGWKNESSKETEGSAAVFSVGNPVEQSTLTASIEHSVLSARRWVVTMLTLAVASLLVMMASLRFGAEEIGLADSARILLQALRYGDAGTDSSGVIILQVRLPRVLLGFMVGANLTTSAIACADSNAGTMPSSRDRRSNADSASSSVADVYRMRPASW